MGAAGCSGQKSAQVDDTVKKITANKDAMKKTQQDIKDENVQKMKKGKENPSINDMDPLQELNISKEYHFTINWYISNKHYKMWKAIMDNDLQAIQKYFEQNELTINEMYDQANYTTMLHLAAMKGHVDILMTIIEQTGCKADITNQSLATPLHVAIKFNQEQVVKFLLGCGVDVNIQDEHGQTPILVACIHGFYSIAQLIIDSSIDGNTPDYIDCDLKDHRGLTPLNCAAIKGDLKLSQLLISKGKASVDKPSPKGCTPLLYAARGNYSDLVDYLLNVGASPLHQDVAGGTVLHHAIEKGHIKVLETILQNDRGYEACLLAIEIPDNGGRTPIFEAIDNNVQPEIIDILVRPRKQQGFNATVNICNYNGQTPLFAACREGAYEIVKILVEIGKADLDLSQREQVQNDDEDDEEEYESIQEKNFIEAFNSCMTPLHIALVLDHAQIIEYLLQNGADISFQTYVHGYSSLHLCILGNKLEYALDILKSYKYQWEARDYRGRTLLDLIKEINPTYYPLFEELYEQFRVEQLRDTNTDNEKAIVATHYYNPDDERKIQGVGDNLKDYYQNSQAQGQDQDEKNRPADVNQLQEQEIEIEEGRIYEKDIELVFGKKIALGLISVNWKIKENCMKVICKQTEKFVQKASHNPHELEEIILACALAIDGLAKEKVLKVFTYALTLMNLILTASNIEKLETSDGIILDTKFRQVLYERGVIGKLLQKSEEGNARITNRIHECFIDMAYHPVFNDQQCIRVCIARINNHIVMQDSYKGLLAELALLYKFINTFGVDSKAGSSLYVMGVIQAALPAMQHSNQDIRSTALKILIDVHRLSGLINASTLSEVPEKLRMYLLDKVKDVTVVKTLYIAEEDAVNAIQVRGENGVDEEDIREKGASKVWTEREEALKHIKESFFSNDAKVMEEKISIIKVALEENNISLYLAAIDTLKTVLDSHIYNPVVFESLQFLLKPVVLRTSDSNTRVRKKSVELILSVWAPQSSIKNKEDEKKQGEINQLLCQVIMEQEHQDKGIIGRIALFIKKLQSIDRSEDGLLGSRPHQVLIGINYEQLILFACQWAQHKNVKVRDNSMKLILEICKLNAQDSKGGGPFKQRIVACILGLRVNIRDPLLRKINKYCGTRYIDIQEAEINAAAKTRSVSVDHAKKLQKEDTLLPQIAVQEKQQQALIVLPHSEPLNEEQLGQYAQLILLFGQDLVTCLFSQTWSTRNTALNKVKEQLHNLDPQRRDAMSAEINKKNLSIEESFRIFLEMVQEGLKDPVLKNYILLLEVVQHALPIFFRYIPQLQVREQLLPIVQSIIQKTSDLKQIIREQTIRFCLYLSHQSPIGPEVMTTVVLEEINKAFQINLNKGNVAQNVSKSNMIISCMQILYQYQQQKKILESKGTNQAIYTSFLQVINIGLKHQNPQIRREGEALFKLLYGEFGNQLDSTLQEQKQQVRDKLIMEARQESGTAASTTQQQELEKKYTLQKTTNLIKDEIFNQKEIINLFKTPDGQALLKELKQPNPQKRIKAIIEMKKVLQRELITQQKAQIAFEPYLILLRALLLDENIEVYMEVLNLLKFLITSLAQAQMNQLEINIMMGQFLGIILTNEQSSNMRVQIACDKVIIYFAKNNNIGPCVIGRDILKNVEKIAKSIQQVQKKEEQMKVIEEKKSAIIRFLSIILLLFQHFSIILLYNQDFLDQFLKLLADILLLLPPQYNDTLKQQCAAIVLALQKIDAKTLDQGVSKIDVFRKTPLKKVIIENEALIKNEGEKIFTQDHHAFINTGMTNIGGAKKDTPNFGETRGSFVSSSRTSLFSPGSSMSQMGTSQYSNANWAKKSIDSTTAEKRLTKRMVSLDTNRYERQSSTIEDRPLILPEIKNSMAATGMGGMAQMIDRNAPQRQMSMTVTGNFGAASFNAESQRGVTENRPPLYVPTRRQPTMQEEEVKQSTTGVNNYQRRNNLDPITNNVSSSQYTGMITSYRKQGTQNSIFNQQPKEVVFQSGVKRYNNQEDGTQNDIMKQY